ncbi:MAG: SpoIIE family protein phosphatase [Leptolyngbyaceae bacterium]|nr:SpoIIE family protein phosphatase [Leptolyngbyaceae bacterium]
MFSILIIDDDSTTRALLQRTLQKQGYTVSVASNGALGIEQAVQLRPALIICDWMMPQMDGLEVCRQVKADPKLATTFFILLTSRGASEDRVKGLDTGADDFLAKPVDMDELKARVRAGLRIYQLTQDLQSKNQVLENLTQDLQAQKALLEGEFLEAADYVRSLLPPVLTGDPSIDHRFIPSSQLGGDCFDYYWLDPDYLVMYLLDVSGHGLGAALPSIAVLNLLRSRSLEDVNFYQPNQVLEALNEVFQMSDQNEKYFTIWYGTYNRDTRKLTYASAGHPPALLLSGTDANSVQIQRLRTQGLPIGMLPNSKFVNASCVVEPNSALYIFSDGIYEIHQKDGTAWHLDGLAELVTQHRINYPQDLNQFLEQIKLRTSKFAFDDDVSLMQVNFS